MHHLKILPIIVGAIALAACGGESAKETSAQSAEADAPGKPPTSSDPCGYIGKDEVAAIIGETVVNASADGDMCRYETEDAMASAVQLDVKQSGGAAEMDAARSAAGTLGNIGGQSQGAAGAEGDAGALIAETAAAPKIGDSAFFGANAQLHVLKGDAYFAVQPPQMRSRMSAGNPMLSTEQKREMAVAIAQRVAAKL